MSNLRALSNSAKVVVATATLLYAAMVSGPASAQHIIEAGDVLEFSIASIPTLKQRANVNVNGEVSFPLLNDLGAAGLSLSELRAKVQELLSSKPFRQRTPDGREILQTIDPSEITINIVEYRPIYVNGDVSKPGEQAYRPGVTVRQAITLAGGYDIARFRMGNPIMEAADLRAEYEATWTELVKQQAVLARLEAELAGKGAVEGGEMRGSPLQPQLSSRIVSREAEQLRARNADLEKERVFLQRSVAQTDYHLSVLTEQQKNEKAGVELDTADFERAREIFQKGAATVNRVTEARRSMLLSSTRLLQTDVQLAQSRSQKEQIQRSLQRLDDRRRIDLLREIQEAEVKLNAVRARLEAVSQKLLYTGSIKSQISRSGKKPEVTIARRGRSGTEQVVATDDTELKPGDVVEVALNIDPLSLGSIR